MLTWIASFFRPAEPANKPADIEAGFKPKPLQTSTIASPTSRTHTVSAQAPLPFASRTVNFVYGVFALGRPTVIWTNAKYYFNSGSTYLSGTLSGRSARGLGAPASSSSRKSSSEPEMVELPIHNPRPTVATTSSQVSKYNTRLSPTPLPTPPVTPCPTGPYYTITDFIEYSPYKLRVNPYYQPLAAISEQWLDDHQVHPSARKRAAFEACNFGLLTAMCYPDADYDRFRVLCDYINTLFAYDDLTDEGGLRKDGDGTRKASDIIMNAIAHPFTYETEFRCGQVFSSFWGRAIELGCSPGTQRRFLEYTDLYVQAVHEQVLHRARDNILPLDEFIRLRRDTGALKMCFAMGEFGLNVDIPDVVFECPQIRIMEDCANDVVVLSNDIYSYNIEQAQGDTCNIIEAAMKERGLDVQGAMDYAGELVKGRIDLYTATKAQLPSWGPKVDADVQRYLRVCEDWMTGGFHWSLESKRYFGEQVASVKKTLCVEILPKEAPRGQIAIPDLDRAS